MPVQLDTIEKLIAFMEKYDLAELSVRQGDLEFRSRRGERKEPSIVFQPAHGIVHSVPSPALAAETAAISTASTSVIAADKPAVGKPQKEICSPIVGTFYRKPNPNSPPYKEHGDHVDKEDVVCVVEAMKVMNEIKAEVKGKLVKILVEDASPVEFGQALFLVELD